MQGLFSLIILVLAIAGCQANDPTVSLTGVVDLTPDNFDSIVNGAKHALVEFYAPWCGHCKHLVPEYKKLGEAVSSDPALSSRIVVAKVDADKHRSLGERFSVRGFPTILYFSRGKPTTESDSYEQGRTAEAMLGFLKDKLEADKSFARVEALDSIVKGFVSADDKSAILGKLEEAVSGLEGDDAVNGQIYVDVLKKAIAKGDEYLGKEKARVDRIILAGGVHPTKLDQISRKSNIISAVLGDE